MRVDDARVMDQDVAGTDRRQRFEGFLDFLPDALYGTTVLIVPFGVSAIVGVSRIVKKLLARLIFVPGAIPGPMIVSPALSSRLGPWGR